MTRFTRRRFLGGTVAGSAILTFGPAAPGILAHADATAKNNQRILLVVEMAGGNDGLNSVVPHADPDYRKARPRLAISTSDVLGVRDAIGLHASLRGFADLLEDGHFAVIQGVGYPNPNRSHFESMDIWHTCRRKDESRPDGWLGRYLETVAATPDPAGLHLGADKQPFALMSRDVRVPSIQSLEQFRLRGNDSLQFKNTVHELANIDRDADNDLLGFVQSSTSSAIAASERLEATGMRYKPAVAYPESSLAEKLKTVAQLISSGLRTNIYYVRIDGFDTHANQPAAHAALLKQVSESVTAFLNDQIAQGNGERVLVMCFSEFGRRVAENASDGTDHGTAGPIFVAGTQIRAGLIGKHPSLQELQDGDLIHHTDFRQVYATVLQRWLNCQPDDVLGGRFAPIDLFDATA